MDLKKLSELNYWQWFGICLTGACVMSLHQLNDIAKGGAGGIFFMASLLIVVAAALAYFMKRYYSVKNFGKFFSKRPFGQLIDSGFQITGDHLIGNIDGYICKAGISLQSTHMMEMVWFEIYFANPSKNQEEWNERFQSLLSKSSKKTEWSYNKVRKNHVTYLRRIGYEKLLSDVRLTIELLHAHNLNAK